MKDSSKKKVRRRTLQRTLEYISAIALARHDLENDVRGFGEFLDTKPELARKILSGVSDAYATLAEARRALKRERAPYLRRQTKALGISRKTSGLKLNIASGGYDIPGWINIDLPPAADLKLNVTWGLPLRSGSCRLVFCSHFLEHLYYPDETLRFLKEVRRVLGRAGVLRVVVPDIGDCFRAYAANDREYFESRKKIWEWAKRCKTHLLLFLGYAGAGVRPEIFDRHKFGYDFATLRLLLLEAGFKTVRKSGYMASRNKELLVDDVSPLAQAKSSRGVYYSLFAEASSR